MDSRTPIIRLSTLDFIIGVSGLIAWGASLIGLVTNLWLGSSILLAAFGLLTYEFWKWAKYKGWAVALRIAVVIIADAVVLFTGSRQVIYQYHQDLVQTGARSQSLNVTSTIASAQAYLANTLLWVRWGWVIPSIVIGVFLGMILNISSRRRLRKLACPDNQLHGLAEDDKTSIKSLVRIPGIAYQPCFDPEGPYLDFVVSVFNGSLFDVVIDNSIGGYLWNVTDSKKFHYPIKIESDEPIICRSRRDNFFIVRQPLRFEEISAFKDKEKVLSLGSLVITFAGEGIDKTQLDANHTVETKKGGWRAWDQIGFICSYSDERWAALQSGNVAHSIELDELRAKVKTKDTTASQVSDQPEAPEVRCDDQQFYDITMKDDYIVKASAFDRRYRINKAAFVDFKLKYDEEAGKAIDLKAEVVFATKTAKHFTLATVCGISDNQKKFPLDTEKPNR